MVNTVIPSSYGPIYDITIQKADVVLNAAANAGHQVIRIYGYNTTPDHNNRQCVDFMVTDGVQAPDTKIADFLVSYLIKNAHALGVEGIIYNHRVMGFPSNGTMYRGPEGSWRPYSGPSPHTDHVHVQFNTNAIHGKVEASTPKPAKKRYKLWTLKPTEAFNKAGKKVKTYPAGKSFTGTIAPNPFGDGRYLVVFKIPHRLWLPLDNHNFSHTKGGKSLQDD